MECKKFSKRFLALPNKTIYNGMLPFSSKQGKSIDKKKYF